MILSALMNGIKIEGPLMAKLARRLTLVTLQQFMRKVEELINREETISALTKAKAGNPWDCSGDAKEEVPSLRKKTKGRRRPKVSEKKFEPFRGQTQS
jgi:Zn-finger domain-containing protein